MRILLAGDSHGDSHFIQYLCMVAQDKKCTLIIQLGDFGLWPGPGGKWFLEKTEAHLTKAGIELWWLDGNHEDHSQIEAWAKADPDFYTKWHKLSDHIFYLPRGFRFALGGISFMSLGGAWSIDRGMRTPNISWWPQEELTQADYHRATEDLTPIDVLLTHDMPARKDAYAKFPWMAQGGESNRQYVQAVASLLKANLHVHGHMHAPYRIELGNGRLLVALDCNMDATDAWAVLDTEAQTITSSFGSVRQFRVHEK